MRLNKRVFYFSVITSLFTLGFAVLFNFCFCNPITDFICNIFLNIFAGTIVLIVTSLFDYFIQKRKILNATMAKINEFVNIFSNLEFIENINEYPAYEEYKKYYDEQKIKYTKRMYNKEKEVYFNRIKKKTEKMFDEYIKISELNFNDIWSLFSEICFLNLFDKDREDLYENVFNYIYLLLTDIREQTFHFKIYKEAVKGNFEVNYGKILELQNKFFYYEQRYGEDSEWEYPKYFENRDIVLCCKNDIRNSCLVVFNKVKIHLLNMYVKVGRINYSKKYDIKR